MHHSYLNFETYEKLYNTYVCPNVDYCSDIWAFRKHDKCITVQNRALQAFLGVNRFTANAMITCDTGWNQTMYECGYPEYYDRFLPCTPILDSFDKQKQKNVVYRTCKSIKIKNL